MVYLWVVVHIESNDISIIEAKIGIHNGNVSIFRVKPGILI